MEFKERTNREKMSYQKDSMSKVNMLKDHEDQIKLIITDVSDIKVQKAEKSVVETLHARLDKFTELEHMEYLQNTLLPKMYTFAD